MQGENVSCPHCGLETTLIPEAIKPSKLPLIHDPDWEKRISNAVIRVPIKVLGTSIQLIYGLLMLAAIVVIGILTLVFLLRCLHAAWGY